MTHEITATARAPRGSAANLPAVALAGLLLAPLALFLTQPAAAASFDCAKAGTAVEKMICVDAELSKLDEALGAEYARVLAQAADQLTSKTLKARQRIWLRDTRDACTDAACVKAAYEARIAELANIGKPVLVGDRAFAVDRAAYVANAKTVLAHLLEGREFYDTPYMSDDEQRRAAELVQKLRDGNFEIVPPFEWSDDNPDLPTYVAARKRCPNFDFEMNTANGVPVTATEWFGLYQLPVDLSSSGESQLLAYRAERFVYRNGRVGWPGIFVFFTIEGCLRVNGESIVWLMPLSRGHVFNEIIKVGNQFFVMNLHPLTQKLDGYWMSFHLLGKGGARTQIIYSLSTVKK